MPVQRGPRSSRGRALRSRSSALSTIVKPRPAATRNSSIEISYLKVLEQGLKVMDATAISLCMDNKLPIVVFNLRTRGNLRRVIMGEPVGTTVTAE